MRVLLPPESALTALFSSTSLASGAVFDACVAEPRMLNDDSTRTARRKSLARVKYGQSVIGDEEG